MSFESVTSVLLNFKVMIILFCPLWTKYLFFQKKIRFQNPCTITRNCIIWNYESLLVFMVHSNWLFENRFEIEFRFVHALLNQQNFLLCLCSHSRGETVKIFNYHTSNSISVYNRKNISSFNFVTRVFRRVKAVFVRNEITMSSSLGYWWIFMSFFVQHFLHSKMNR